MAGNVASGPQGRRQQGEDRGGGRDRATEVGLFYSLAKERPRAPRTLARGARRTPRHAHGARSPYTDGSSGKKLFQSLVHTNTGHMAESLLGAPETQHCKRSQQRRLSELYRVRAWTPPPEGDASGHFHIHVLVPAPLGAENEPNIISRRTWRKAAPADSSVVEKPTACAVRPSVEATG